MAKKKKKIDNRKQVDIRSNLKSVDVGLKDNVFIFTGPLSVNEFSKNINKAPSEIIKLFFMKGEMLSINSVLDEEKIAELCLEFGYDFQMKKEVNETNVLESIEVTDEEHELKKRAPIITIMGHVDHGKTTLLDTIRNANVAKGEAGGITQHIGAYQVNHNGSKITFIDTPGHAAFTAMRARGANVTDVVIIVVAADDGMMPQTEEAIDHAKSSGVPIIVFINKMDKQAANPDRVMGELAEKDLTPEEWGGDTIFIKGSALKGEGIEELLENITLLAEVHEWRANPDRLAIGTVIESHVDKGLGPVATLLVQNGSLTIKDMIVAGSSVGRVRTMLNAYKKPLKVAEPSTPVLVSGLDSVPAAGDKFVAILDEKLAKDLAEKRKYSEKMSEKAALSSWKNSLNSEDKVLNIIIKSDVQGSVEAIKNILSKAPVEGATINIIRASVGPVTESDVMLAKTSEAVIYSFNNRLYADVKAVADQNKVDIRTHSIIYKLKEEIEGLLTGMLEPVFEEEIVGEAEVREIWTHSKVGVIIGAHVNSGTITRKDNARVIRNGDEIYNGTILSLKHVKDDIREIKEGRECGMTISKLKDIEKGDIIQVYKMVEVK